MEITTSITWIVMVLIATLWQGGDLAPEKCVWYLIAHRWKKGVPTLIANKTTHRRIEMK
jgi:hypothetical protein